MKSQQNQIKLVTRPFLEQGLGLGLTAAEQALDSTGARAAVAAISTAASAATRLEIFTHLLTVYYSVSNTSYAGNESYLK